jgi:hypothetical protein
MRLALLSLVLFAALQGHAQQGGAQQTAGAGLTRTSFSASGLANERLLTNLYIGDFMEIDLKRSDVLFGALYNEYMKSYGRHCAAYLPKNKVELKETYCEQEAYNVDRYGNKTPASSCLVYSTRGTGIYADPTLYAAKEQLDSATGPEMIQQVFRSMAGPNPLGTALSALGATEAMTGDMDRLLGINACPSPALKRFQENMMLFALGKQPIILPGAAPSITSRAQPSAPGTFTDQNYTRLLNDLISEQSRTWALNRYVPGSTSNVAVSSRDAAGRPSKIVGSYLFNGQSRGSVTVDFSDGVPGCIYFFDSPSTCKTPSRGIVATYSSGGYHDPAGTLTSAPASRPANLPAAGRPIQPAPVSGAATQTVPPAAPARVVNPPAAPAAAAPVTPAPDNSAAARAKAIQEQQALVAQRQAAAKERAAESQQKVHKMVACIQQLSKDHPDGGQSDRAAFQKEYLACVQPQ